MADIEVRSNTPVDIDTQEVLREYGLADATHTYTVVSSSNGTTVTIPEGNSLTPPPIDTVDTVDTDSHVTTDSNIDEALNSLADDMLNLMNNTESEVNNIDVVADDDDFNIDIALDSGEPPVSVAVGRVSATVNETSVTTENVNEANTTTSYTDTTITDSSESTPLTAEEAINLLPVNSLSYATDETSSRFSGAMWYNEIQKSTIVLAGMGGIGSYCLFCLSRMKPKQIFIYDDDTVELANLSGQLYSIPMVGKKKVDAMASLAKDFSNYHSVQAVPQKFTEDIPAGDIMICGFDNMEARNGFFNAWVKHLVNHPHPENCLFIDGRL